MKKSIIFEADIDSIIFKDSESDTSFFTMTEEILREKMRITDEYGRKESNVPDEFTIKVSPMSCARSKDYNADVYKPTLELIDFPINRIEWVIIRISSRT